MRLVTGFLPRRPEFAPRSGKWDLWWAKWRLGRFSPSTSVSPAKTVHSTNFSIHTITRVRYNRPGVAAVPSGPSMDSTPHYSNNKKKIIFTDIMPHSLVDVHKRFGVTNCLYRLGRRGCKQSTACQVLHAWLTLEH
jgi:hypothetical protein